MVAITSKQLSQELLEQQLGQSTKKKSVSPVEPARAVGVQYNAELQRLTREIARDVNRELVPTIRALRPEYTADGWVDDVVAVIRRITAKYLSPEFIARYTQMAAQFVAKSNAANRRKWKIQAKKVGIDVFGSTPGIEDYLSASVVDNANLIKSIPEKYMQQVESIVLSNMRAGGRPAVIQRALTKQLGVESRRAKTIARDQTAKINGDLSKKRAENAGFKYFRWQTVKDGRVGDDHRHAQNRQTKFGKGVYTYAEGAPEGWPGNADRPNCRCVAIPLVTSDVEG